MTLYPWLQTDAEKLADQLAGGRLPHALLLVGGTGLGARALIQWLEALLLCQAQSVREPCGQCRSCTLLRAGNHADSLHLMPEGKARLIKVDAVRHMLQFSQGTPQLGAHQVVVLEQADALNLAASNALLKVLEEPPKGTFILLQTDDPARLLPTIRSRVQWLRLSGPDAEAGQSWLAEQGVDAAQGSLLLSLAEGQPCRALEMADPEYLKQRQVWLDALSQQVMAPQRSLQNLDALIKAEPEPVLSVWRDWVADAQRLLHTGEGDWVRNRDQMDTLNRALEKRPSRMFWARLYGLVDELDAQLSAGNNLNWQLLLEDFWLRIPREIKLTAQE